MAIALWLVPKKNTQIYDVLSSLMHSLQSLFPDAPSFEPHVTITSQLDLKYKSEVNNILNASLIALNSLNLSKENLITFHDLKTNKSYFKKLAFDLQTNTNLISFARIIRELFVILPSIKKNNVENLTVVDLEKKSAELAAIWSTEEFHPHLSLIYSNIYPLDKAMLRTISIRIQDFLDIPSIQNLSEYNIGWSGGQLKIVNCEGPVTEWEVLGSIDIH